MADQLEDGSDVEEHVNSGFDRMQNEIGIEGYRDGVIEGKESTVQAGFNEGFSCASRLSFELRRWRGMASAILASECATDKLQRLCKDVLHRLDTLQSLHIPAMQRLSDTQCTQTGYHQGTDEDSDRLHGVSSFEPVPSVLDQLSLLKFHSKCDMLDAIGIDRKEEVIQLMGIMSQITKELDATLNEARTTAS